MDKNKIIIILVVCVSIILGSAGYLLNKASQKNDEASIRKVVENFGYTLKNFSLNSPEVKQEMEKNYKDFVSENLLLEWGNNPSKAVGRIASNPWPDKIEISSIVKKSTSYEVNGNIIMATGPATENGNGPRIIQPVILTLGKVNNRWLITSAKADDFKIDNPKY